MMQQQQYTCKFILIPGSTKTVQPVFCYSGVTLRFPDLFFPQRQEVAKLAIKHASIFVIFVP